MSTCCALVRTLQLMCNHFVLIYHGCTIFVAAVHHLHWAFAFVFMEMFKGASPSTAASVWASGVQLMDNGLQCQIAGRLGYAEKTPVHRAGSSSSRHCRFQTVATHWMPVTADDWVTQYCQTVEGKDYDYEIIIRYDNLTSFFSFEGGRGGLEGALLAGNILQTPIFHLLKIDIFRHCFPRVHP